MTLNLFRLDLELKAVLKPFYGSIYDPAIKTKQEASIAAMAPVRTTFKISSILTHLLLLFQFILWYDLAESNCDQNPILFPYQCTRKVQPEQII